MRNVVCWDLRIVALVIIDVSEEYITSSIMVESSRLLKSPSPRLLILHLLVVCFSMSPHHKSATWSKVLYIEQRHFPPPISLVSQSLFLACRFFPLSWWRRYVLPKRRFLQWPLGVTFQNTSFFIVTTEKISNLTTCTNSARFYIYTKLILKILTFRLIWSCSFCMGTNVSEEHIAFHLQGWNSWSKEYASLCSQPFRKSGFLCTVSFIPKKILLVACSYNKIDS
jgi:hypothetical protein